MKNYVNEIFTKTYKIEQTLGINSQNGVESSQIRNTLDTIQNEIRQFRSHQTQILDNFQVVNCPKVSCVSFIYLIAAVITQTLVIIGFIYVRYCFFTCIRFI